jgi:hypothetical protein
MLSGSFRRVFVLGRFAIKVPRIRFLSLGMRCNRWEREMWRTWRPVFGWIELCPIVFADPLGVVVVMPRPVQPVTLEEIRAASSDHPLVVIDCAPDDWGRVDGCARVVDYGLPFADMIDEQRALYARMAANHH